MTFWNQAFDTPHFKYGTAPNAFVRAQAHRLRPAARVLVPGDGEGRNGVWLAAQGHAVLSVDASAVGLRKARQLAQQQGVPLQTELADSVGSWVTVIMGVIFVICVLLFRRGIVGELQALIQRAGIR